MAGVAVVVAVAGVRKPLLDDMGLQRTIMARDREAFEIKEVFWQEEGVGG